VQRVWIKRWAERLRCFSCMIVLHSFVCVLWGCVYICVCVCACVWFVCLYTVYCAIHYQLHYQQLPTTLHYTPYTALHHISSPHHIALHCTAMHHTACTRALARTTSACWSPISTFSLKWAIVRVRCVMCSISMSCECQLFSHMGGRRGQVWSVYFE
jgi:hypothetical protein